MTTPRSGLGARASTWLKALVERHIGVFPAIEFALKIRRSPGAARNCWRERREARFAMQRLDGRVTADVVTIIPTYLRADLAKAAVLSALAQQDVDEVDHQIVVIDDGGGELPDVDHPRVHLVTLSRNIGTAGVVRNIGLRISSSPRVAFLDDDNAWLPEHLAISLAAHADGAQFTYTTLRRRLADGTLLDHLGVPFDRHRMRHQAYVDTNAVVVVRDRGVWFSRVPRRRDTIPGEDWEFAHRLSRRLRTQHVDVTTVEYRIHAGSYYTDWD